MFDKYQYPVISVSDSLLQPGKFDLKICIMSYTPLSGYYWRVLRVLKTHAKRSYLVNLALGYQSKHNIFYYPLIKNGQKLSTQERKILTSHYKALNKNIQDRRQLCQNIQKLLTKHQTREWFKR